MSWLHSIFNFAGSRIPTATYIGRSSSTSNTDTYTFTGQSIGTASNDRLVIVCVLANKPGAGATNFSVTCGGVAMTVIQAPVTEAVGMWRLLVPSGATADIIVSFGVSVNRCDIEVYTIKNYVSQVPLDSDSDDASPLSQNLVVSGQGCAIGCARSDDSTTTSWTGLTEDADNVVEGITTCSAAHQNNLAASAAYNIAATFGSNNSVVMLVASWR